MPSLLSPVPCRTITAGRRCGAPASAAVRPGTRCCASVVKVNSSHAIRPFRTRVEPPGRREPAGDR